MRQALLLVQTKGKPDERHVGPFTDMSAKLKSLSVPDTHATLYVLQRVKHRHFPALPVVATPPPVEPVVAPAEPKLWKKKGQ